MTVTVIAAVGLNRVIGSDGGLPWRLPADLRRFRGLTTGHTLVMGRRTFESIGRALPGRTTVVVTRQAGWSARGVAVSRSLPEALARAPEGEGEIFVAGGGEIYRQAMPLADRLEITEVELSPDGDVLFPGIDRNEWREVAREPRDGYAFVRYERRR